MTSDKEWDPTIFDDHYNIEATAKKMSQELHSLPHKDYDITGEYIHTTEWKANFSKTGHVTYTDHIEVDDVDIRQMPSMKDITVHNNDFDFWLTDEEYNHHETINRCVKAAELRRLELETYDVNISSSDSARIHTPSKMDYESLKPHFSWVPTKLIEATFKNSTQYGYMPTSPDGNLFK